MPAAGTAAEDWPPSGAAAPAAAPRTVAVKRLKPHVLESEDDVVAFIQEARLLTRLRHPSIIEFIGLGTSDASCPEAAWRTMFLVQEVRWSACAWGSFSGGLHCTLRRAGPAVGAASPQACAGGHLAARHGRALARAHVAQPKVTHPPIVSLASDRTTRCPAHPQPPTA